MVLEQKQLLKAHQYAQKVNVRPLLIKEAHYTKTALSHFAM